MRFFRSGLSTGSCAAAAAKAAIWVLTTKQIPRMVEIDLPDGSREKLCVSKAHADENSAMAVVIKDGGDDPDVTHQASIIARVTWRQDDAISFRAGEGVGVVTLPGLSVPKGEPAINPVPQKMIRAAIREVTRRGVEVTVAVPGGKEIAKSTYNARLGVVGGISILGTSGRVRPFSTPAVRDTIRCLFQVAQSNGIQYPVLVPGRIGARGARQHFDLRAIQLLEVGNEWGYALDCLKEFGYSKVLLVGHPGKLAKLCEGHFDTHSSRSPSALPGLHKLASSLAGRHLPSVPTIEGLFRILSVDEKRVLANELARRITRVTAERTAAQVSAFLVDMKGDSLGLAGELSVWN